MTTSILHRSCQRRTRHRPVLRRPTPSVVSQRKPERSFMMRTEWVIVVVPYSIAPSTAASSLATKGGGALPLRKRHIRHAEYFGDFLDDTLSILPSPSQAVTMSSAAKGRARNPSRQRCLPRFRRFPLGRICHCLVRRGEGLNCESHYIGYSSLKRTFHSLVGGCVDRD